MKPGCIAFLLMCHMVNCFAQDAILFKPDSVKKQITAVAITSMLQIDGQLDEPEWKLTGPSPKFTEIEPYQNQNPHFQTDIRVLFNQKYLYIGVTAFDSLGTKAIRATDFKRDFIPDQHDHISVAFDCFNDKRNAMSFTTNAYGVQRDLLSFDDLKYDVDWNGLWYVRTNRTDSGWTAEIAIPWKTLRYPKGKGAQTWGFNVYRNRRFSNETSAFSPFPRSYSFLRMNYAGLITNLKPPAPGSNVRFQPYFLTSLDNYKGFDSTYQPRSTGVKTGGDIKWAITPNAVLDLTANTDFAQADVDEQVNNLSRFDVFFPEKRQFFLEYASFFAVNVSPAEDLSGGSMQIQPFFSRRIGLDEKGTPIPVVGGGRFVYRSSSMNYGAMLMRQKQFGDVPEANFFVGAVSKNLGQQSRVGGLVTVKDNINNTNIVSALDGFFRFGNAHSLNTLFVRSANSHTGGNGFAGITQYVYSTNRWKMWWTESVVTKNFDPEVGFVSRKDVIGTTPGVNLYYRGKHLPFKKWLRAFEPGISAEFYHQPSNGKFIERNLLFNPIWLNLLSGGYVAYLAVSHFERLTEPFYPLGIYLPAGDYHYGSQEVVAGTNASKKLSLTVLYNWGTYYNGKIAVSGAIVQYAPTPHISILGHINHKYLSGVGEPVTKKTVDLYSLEARFALNPQLQLVGFYQKNSVNELDNYNIRFSWEYKPLSYVYLVINHLGYNSAERQMIQDHAIAKVSYLKQF